MTSHNTNTDSASPKSGNAGVEKRKAGQKALQELMKPVQWRIRIAQVLAFISCALAVAPYVALVALGDTLLTAQIHGAPVDSERVKTIIFWLVTAFLNQAFLYTLALLITHFADLRLVHLTRVRIIRTISRAPLSWFGNTSAGRIRKAVDDDTRSLHTLVAHAPVDLIMAVGVPLFLLIFAFTIDWRLGLLTIVSIPIYLALQMFSMKDMGAKTAEMDAYLGEVSATAVEFAEGIGVVKAFGTTGKAHQRYIQAAENFADFYYAWVQPLLRIGALSESVIGIPLILLINIGGGWMFTDATAPEIVATTLIALILPTTIQNVGMMVWSFQLAGNAALHLKDLVDLPPIPEGTGELKASPTPVATSTAAGVITFDNVSFSYGDSPVIENFSATLQPGTVTALVGPSGSGKSTLATMLARFQDPDSGRITIGGVDIRELTFAELYRTVSFVLQTTHLLRVSIRDNIRLARPDASDEAVWEAARAAQISEFIMELDDGLDTVIGDDIDVSGGQAQRIAIARAILADAPILILDEATTAVDPDAEAEIQTALNSLVKGKTVLVIAHKPEAIVGVDQVIRLNAAVGKQAAAHSASEQEESHA